MEEFVDNVAKEMEHLHKLAVDNRAKRFQKLWENMISEKWLSQAWEEIRRNKGSQTPGVDKLTAEDVDLSRIRRLSERLRSNTYSPIAVRRTYIPKSNGKLRPLGIPSIEDRIVQQGLRMVLEPIFEADFLPCSHGFRQGHSPHTALRDVARMYPRVSWVIEGDIVSCFDNIPHNGLLTAVARRIVDGKVLSLVSAFLKAGYMEYRQYHQTYSGTPQGGIISPLLCNIFLHQLDEYMVSLGANRVQTEKERNQRRSANYLKVSNAISWARRNLRGNLDRQARRELLTKLEKLEKEQRTAPVYDERHHTKLGYVRYADDFVILVNGTKEEAIDYENKIEGHLAAMGLTLSEEKTSITHWEKPIRFLGYDIHGEQRAKGVQITAVLSIPKEKERAIRRELVRVASYHHIPEIDAMMSMSAKFRGWCNYYKYANCPQVVFSRVAQKMWRFYAHFLARKHRSSMKALLIRAKRNGSLRMITKGTGKRGTFTIDVGKGKRIFLDVFPPKSEQIRQVSNKENWTVDLKPVNPAGWLRGRSAATRLSALARSNGLCERCQKNPAVQVHHKDRMKAKRSILAKVASDRDQQNQARALCKECHLEDHHGTWQG
jgi:group II intron reverse transcriptase/maturase